MRCTECGFSMRGKKHTSGYPHRNLVRTKGVIAEKNEKGFLLDRVTKRAKPLPIEEEEEKKKEE